MNGFFSFSYLKKVKHDVIKNLMVFRREENLSFVEPQKRSFI